MRVAVLLSLLALQASRASYRALAQPQFLHSCTVNLTGGPRLPFTMCNASASLERRVQDIVARMTPREKAASLDTSNPAVPRLGLPSLPGGEGLHGVVCGCGAAVNGSTGCPTSFPSPIALGATFDADLYREVGAAVGMEARALNNQGKSGIYLFTPNINLVRDPRWGRIQEVPSESPAHTSAYATNFIAGFQTGPIGAAPSPYLLAASTAKHLSVYDLEGFIPRTDPLPRPASAVCDTPHGCERWNFDGSPPKRDYADFYLPAFRAAVEANVSSIMCSYNAAYGRPTCADDRVNNALLRDDWGWQGFMVSDCTALELFQDLKWDNCKPPYPPAGACRGEPFPGGHNYTFTAGDTVKAALRGGCDYNCGSLFRVQLWAALQDGSVTQKDIDLAVSRVYATHIRLGMLDPMDDQPFVKLRPDVVDSGSHRALALRAAEEAMVLLKNDDNLLPLRPDVKLAFIGPHANATQAMLSNYHGENTLVNTHSPLQVAQRSGLDVAYAKGCNICDVVPPGFPNMPCPPGKAKDRSGFAAAVAAAKSADVAVVFVGNDQTSEAENFDRDSITLPGVQEDLVLAVRAANPSTVVVLLNGGPVASRVVADLVPAVLEAFYPGELGGDAIINTLFGANNPAGKMPYTAYHANFTQRDIRDVDLQSAGGITHQYFNGSVLFPYGYGLSYTSWDYRWGEATLLGAEWDAAASQLTLPPVSAHDLAFGHGAVSLTTRVSNTGSRGGDCVVLAFVVPGRGAPAGAPLRRLVAFVREQDVAAGKSRIVRLQLTARDFATTNEEGELVRSPRLKTMKHCRRTRFISWPPDIGNDIHSRRLHTWPTPAQVLTPATYRVDVGDTISPARLAVDITGDGPVVLEENKWLQAL